MWEKVQLGDVCTLLNGRAYKKTELLNSGKYPVLRVGNFFTNKNWYYSDLDLDKEKYCDNGDLLYAWSASFGPQIWQGGRVIYHYHIWKTKFSDDRINKKFLYYWFLWDVDLIKAENGAGTTMIHVTKKSMEERFLLLPPLSEQKRIVAILDKAFEGIDAAIANTQANLAAARELFEGYLSRVFNDLNETSEETIIGDQLVLQRGFDITKKQQRPGTIPVVSSGGIKSYHDTAMVNGPGVVIGRKGSLGTVHFVEGPYWPHDTTLWVKDFKGNIPKIIYYFFRSLDVSGLDSGAANPALNRNAVHPIRTRWPKLAHQHTLLNNIEQIDKDTERLETLYQQKLTALHELKQSILAKAFRGELTQDEVAA